METTVISNVRGTPGRKGLTAEQVFDAADAIRAKGSEPTNAEIQKMLGGSFSTISPLLRQWRDGKGAVTPNSQISEVMLKALSAHAQAACAESDKQWRVRMAAATADAESLEEESHRLLCERDALLQDVASIRTNLDSLSGKCKQQEAEIERSRIAEAGVRAAEIEARINLAKVELQRDELLRQTAETEQGVDVFRRQHAQTLAELNATKVELAKCQGRLEIMTDRMFDPPSTPAQHVVQAQPSQVKPG